MPTFTIQTPDGRKLDIEANDEQSALNGAQQWNAQNAQSLSAPQQIEDFAKGAATGVGKGVSGIAGLPVDAANALVNFSDWASGKITGGNVSHPESPGGSQDVQKAIESVTGEFPKPQTTAGQVAETIGSFAPGAMLSGGNVASNLIRYAAMPGAAVETVKHSIDPNSPWKPYAEAAAGVGASMINPARAITPLPVSDTRLKALKTLADEGVTSLTAGQKTGNEGLRYIESASNTVPMGGGKAGQIAGEGQKQFTEAAVRRAGAGPDASPEVLGQNQRRLGNEFERLSNSNNMIPDNQFVTDIVDASKNYKRVPDSQQRQMVQGYIDDIVQHVNNGQMPGPQYQEMRSRLSRQSDSLRQSDPTLAQALGDMRDALDNAMRRSISPADREAWDVARKQYSAQKVLEKAASRSGDVTAEGQITPPNLRNTVAAENRGMYARGQGQFADLARAGAQVMTPLPNSGTAQRLNAFNILNVLNGATGEVVPALTTRAVTSKPMQDYLANQLIRGEGMPKNKTARDLLLVQMLQRAQIPQQPQ